MDDDQSCLASAQTWRGAIESALRQAVSELQERLGPDMHTWWKLVYLGFA